MRQRTDDRGVTVQIGTVMLFGVLIILLSIYQASVVPQQNEQVEFNHNERVQGQLQDLRDELRRTAVTGSGGSSSVELGTRYPVRAFFVNPPPPSGTLRTTRAANASVRNATASGEVGDYWTGATRNFSTRGLAYEPNYHVYQNPPTTVYRNGVLYKQFEGANRTLAGQSLIQGNTIALVALNGSYSQASSGSATVDLQAVSAATRTVTVTNATADRNVTLVLPTRHSNESAAGLWRDLLADEPRVRNVSPANASNAVRVVLEPGTYELKLAKVGVGTGVTGVGPHYVTDVRGDNATVDEDSRGELVVEVRDRYNNPVSGATVNATLVSNSLDDDIAAQGREDETLTGLTTDAEGRVTLTYVAPEDFDDSNRPVEVRVSTNGTPSAGGGFDATTRANLTLDLTAVNADGSGLGGGGGGGADTYDVNWTDASGAGLDCYANLTRCTLNANHGTSVDLTANVSEDGGNVSQASVDYAVNDSDLGSVSPADGTTDGDGESATELTVDETNDSIEVYAASGDDVDPITIRVEDPPTGPDPSPDPALNWSVTDNTDVSNNEPRYSVSYNVSNAWASFDRVEVEFQNLDTPALSETKTRNATQGTVQYSATYGQGNQYNISIRALAANGSVLSERWVLDEADNDDPGGDDDLGSPSAPELAGRWITDASDASDGAVYDASYNATNRNEFGYVEVEFRNLDQPSATRTVTSNESRGRASYAPTYGNGNDYEIVFRVYDTDGLKVDTETVTDPADGNEPSGNRLLPNATSPTLTNVDVNDVSQSWNSVFEVNYTASDPSDAFGSVEVEYKNLDTGETVETDVVTTPSGQVQLDEYEPNGDEFEIRVRLYDESGALVDEETVTDTGDGNDP